MLVLVSLHRNGKLCLMPWSVLAPLYQKGNKNLRRPAPVWRPPGLDRHGLRHGILARYPYIDLSAFSRACLMRPLLRKLPVIRPARLGPSRGSWVCVDEDGPCWAPFEPHRRPQAGKSGDPRSQDTDTSAQGQGVAHTPTTLLRCHMMLQAIVHHYWSAVKCHMMQEQCWLLIYSAPLYSMTITSAQV